MAREFKKASNFKKKNDGGRFGKKTTMEIGEAEAFKEKKKRSFGSGRGPARRCGKDDHL